MLGAGFTGMAAGHASRAVVYEAQETPGGICSSYYMRRTDGKRRSRPPADGGDYRFEVGGGHWIFGGDPSIVDCLREHGPMRRYERRSAVFFSRSRRYVDYPLQDYLEQLDPTVAERASSEMATHAGRELSGPDLTLKEWLTLRFGPTLCALFFHPYNERYTAGLYDRIAPQDSYKSPLATLRASSGRANGSGPNGYNATFVYPVDGLDALARRLAQTCRVEYSKRAVAIDPKERVVSFADGHSTGYESLISTLPLNQTLQLAGLHVDAQSDPHTTALILNVGATSGRTLPDFHWVYVPDAVAEFHRVGFYSNVDRGFLPRSTAVGDNRVSLYVERAMPAGLRLNADDLARYAESVIEELRDWGFIDSVEVVDPSWIDVAYTWSWPRSAWRAAALAKLEAHDIYAAGRYGRWAYQGIADSIRDGLSVGAALSGD